MGVAPVLALRDAKRVRIAHLASNAYANGLYRGCGPMQTLAETGRHAVRRLDDGDQRCPPGVDVLHVHRYCEARVQRIAREARAQGAAVVWDDDDDQLSMPKSVASHTQLSGFAGQRRITEQQKLFRSTDLVTTPSAEIAARLRERGAPETAVVENYLLDPMLTHDRRSHAGVTIGWIAGLEHQMDVERVPIVPALQRLLDELPDVHVVTIGLRLGLRSDRYRNVRLVPFTSLVQTAAEFDVAIAPLADLDFSRARSNIKLKEYAAGGAPWLASPVGPTWAWASARAGACPRRPLVRGAHAADRKDAGAAQARQARRAVGARRDALGDVHRWEALLERARERARALSPTAP